MKESPPKFPGRMCIVFIALLFFAPALSARAADEQIIREVILSGEGIKHPGQILRILPFHEGDTFSIEKMADAISLLKKTNLFDVEAMRWKAEDLPNGVRVIIYLTPYKFIRRIKFERSFPLFERELRRAIHTREGDPFIYERIKEDERRLDKHLENEGYFDSEVEARAEPDKKTGDVILIFRLNKGFTYNLLDVRSHGNRSISDFRIRAEMRRHMLLRYRREALQKGLDDILELYHRKGYYEARVKVREVALDPVLRTVVVYLTFNEGPRAIVKIRGDRHALERSLRKQMTLIDEESIDEFDIENSALRMEEFYRKRGFRNAKIAYTIDKKESPTEDLYTITFNIEPGHRVVVRKVVFKGREEFHSSKLQKQILTGRRAKWWRPPVLADSVLSEDLLALKAFYETWGFEQVQIATPELSFSESGRRVKVTIPITEGPQTIVTEVRFDGMEFFVPDDALAALKLIPGTAYDATLLADDKRRLLVLYADNGFPYAQVAQGVEIYDTPHGRAAEILYKVIENERVRVGELLMRGNYRTRARVLVREIELTSGEPFSYEGLIQSRRNIRSFSFLDSVRLDTLGLEENLDVAHLLLVVQERQSRTIDFGIGYDSELLLLANLTLADLNLFGYGKSGKLTLIGGGDLNEAELTYTDPRFIGFRIRADVTASAQYFDRPAFDLTQAAARFALTKRLSKKFNLTFGLRTEWNVLSNVIDEGEVIDLRVAENTLFGLGPQLMFDSRNDFIEPASGWLVVTKLEYAQEVVHGSQWIRFFTQAATFISPANHFVIALSASYGHIEPFGESLVPVQEAFFVGGNRSVRGYSEDGLGPRSPDGDPLGGLDMVVTNLELRFPIVSVFHGVIFLDSGQLVSNIQELSPENQLFTAGAGLRIQTPVGPIRVDWGYKLEPSPFERRDRWHFSFGYPF